MATDATSNLRRMTGRPTREEAEQLSDLVLDKACELFATNGYAATSIARLAAEAHVGKHSIYRRFADKEALFRAVVQRKAAAIAAAARPPSKERATDTLTALRAMGEDAARTAIDPVWVALYRTALAEASRFPELAAIFLGDEGDKLIFACSHLVEKAQREGSLRPGEPNFIARQYLHAMGSSLLHRQLTGTAGSMDAAALKHHVDAAWRLFVEGAGARKAT